MALHCGYLFPGIEGLHGSRDPIATVTTPPSCMLGLTNMATVNSERVPALRSYRDSLSAENRIDYDQKLKIISGIDPYNVNASFFSQSEEKWPDIEFPDIINYLLLSSSKYTKEQLKAYKSLQAYQFFVAGWVRGIFVGKATPDVSILLGKVSDFDVF